MSIEGSLSGGPLRHSTLPTESGDNAPKSFLIVFDITFTICRARYRVNESGYEWIHRQKADVFRRRLGWDDDLQQSQMKLPSV